MICSALNADGRRDPHAPGAGRLTIAAGSHGQKYQASANGTSREDPDASSADLRVFHDCKPITDGFSQVRTAGVARAGSLYGMKPRCGAPSASYLPDG